MIRINLLPVREARRKANLRQQAGLLAGAIALGLLVCVVLHTAIAAQISAEQTRISMAQEELTKLEATLKEVDRFRKEKEEIEAKLEVISRLETSRTGPVHIMDEIASRIPERLWLNELKLKDGKLEMAGQSIDNEVIAAFMTSLSESKYLKRVELLETSLTESKGLKLNEFKISCEEAGWEKPQAAAGRKSKSSAQGKKRARNH